MLTPVAADIGANILTRSPAIGAVKMLVPVKSMPSDRNSPPPVSIRVATPADILAAIPVVNAAFAVAEFLGGTLGFYLLFRIPMIWAGLLTGVVSVAIVSLDRYGQRAVGRFPAHGGVYEPLAFLPYDRIVPFEYDLDIGDPTA